MTKIDDDTFTAKLNILDGVYNDYRFEREVVEREIARHNANGGVLCEVAWVVS